MSRRKGARVVPLEAAANMANAPDARSAQGMVGSEVGAVKRFGGARR